MTTTCGCGQPAHDAYLCHRCTRRLERDLGDVPALVEQLDLVLARMTAYSDRAGGRAAETPLPFDPRASEVGSVLQSTLVGVTRLVAEERGLAGPETGTGRDGNPNRHPNQGQTHPTPQKSISHTLACWLLPHIEWIRHHPAAYELADKISTAVHQTRRIIDTPANRTTIPIGPCPEHDCPGEIRAYIPADPTAAPHMTCTGPARHRYEPHQWLRAGRRILALRDGRTTTP